MLRLPLRPPPPPLLWCSPTDGMAAFRSPRSFFYNFGVLGRGREVVKVGIEVFSEAGAVGDAGDGLALARACGFEGDVVNCLGGGGCVKRVFATRDARLAFEILLEG